MTIYDKLSKKEVPEKKHIQAFIKELSTGFAEQYLIIHHLNIYTVTGNSHHNGKIVKRFGLQEEDVLFELREKYKHDKVFKIKWELFDLKAYLDKFHGDWRKYIQEEIKEEPPVIEIEKPIEKKIDKESLIKKIYIWIFSIIKFKRSPIYIKKYIDKNINVISVIIGLCGLMLMIIIWLIDKETAIKAWHNLKSWARTYF